MLIDALLAAEPHLHIVGRVFDPEKFVFLNDNIMNEIESSIEPVRQKFHGVGTQTDACIIQELKASRSIIRRIRDRDIYKCVDYKVIDWQFKDLFRTHVTSRKIFDEVKRYALTDPFPASFPELVEDDIIVDLSTMHYGMKEQNPLKYVKFYSKRDPTSTSYTPSYIIPLDELPFRLPQCRKGGLLESPARTFC